MSKAQRNSTKPKQTVRKITDSTEAAAAEAIRRLRDSLDLDALLRELDALDGESK